MGTLTVKFIDKEYSFPQDVLTYIDLLSFTESVQKQLVGSFIRKLNNEIAQDNIGLLDDKDLAVEIEQQVGRFIAKLCDNNIYSHTISDYLKDNKGYELYSKVNKAALEKMKTLLMSELDEWQSGYESAVSNAEAHVTGMGFSIWSGDFVNHAIYAAMESSTLKKQSKEAESQYQKDMSSLRSRLDSKYGGEKSNYINNTYIPNMEAALTVLTYELLDKYVADLIANGKFDSKTLDYVDISRSNDLLKNLTLSNDKKAILESAFVACPYNIAVYMQAMKYDLLDYDSFQTAKVFQQDNKILTSLRNELRDPKDHNRIYFKLSTVKLLALYTDSTIKDVTKHIADFIYKAYADSFGLLTNGNALKTFFAKASENDILLGDTISREKANLIVDSIASQNLWNNIVNVCGHTDLEIRITSLLPSSVKVNDRTCIDNYLKEQLFIAFESTRKELSEQIKTNRIQAEETRRKAEKDKQKKTIKITAIVVSIILLIILIASLPAIIENSKNNKKEAYIESQIQEVVDTLERKIENQIDDDVSITFSYEEFMGYDSSLMWSFKIKMTKFDEFVKSGGKNEQLLLEIMDNCRIIENIVEAENDTFDFSIKYDDTNISVSNYDGTINYANSFSSETFYYEEHSGNRYLHSFNTEYVLEKQL